MRVHASIYGERGNVEIEGEAGEPVYQELQQVLEHIDLGAAAAPTEYHAPPRVTIRQTNDDVGLSQDDPMTVREIVVEADTAEEAVAQHIAAQKLMEADLQKLRASSDS